MAFTRLQPVWSRVVCKTFVTLGSRLSRWKRSADQIENFNIPPGKPRAFDYPLYPGSGELDLFQRGVGKNWTGSIRFQINFFSGAEVANIYKTRVWTT